MAFGIGQHINRNDEAVRKKYEEDWEHCRKTVLNLLYQRNVSQREWQDLFMSIYDIYSWMTDGKNYLKNKLIEDIDRYVTSAQERIRSHVDDCELLRVYAQEWSKYHHQASILPLPFHISEKKRTVPSRLPENSAPPTDPNAEKPIRDIMLEIWRDRVFYPVETRIRSAALRLVDADRSGEMFDDRLVVGVKDSYVILHENDGEGALVPYTTHYEQAFIKESAAYYSAEAAQYMREHGVSAYMEHADARLEDELQRATKYLHPMSIDKHMDEVTRELVVSFMDQILGEAAHLIQANDIKKLRQLHRLMMRVPSGMDVVVTCIDEHIRSEGCADMRANAATILTDPEKYVTALLDLFDRFSFLVKDAFDDDARMLTTRDKAFEHIVNDTSIFAMDLSTPSDKQRRSGRVSIESKCPELLANYADLLLRRTALSKRLSHDQIAAKLQSLLLLLKYIKNKDVFIRFHKAHLSRRLVLEMSADQEREEYMAIRMRECGMPSDAINKLFKMIQDIELNKDLSTEIRHSLRESHGELADLLNVKVLNTGAWGKGGERIHVSLPREVDELIPLVDTYYRKQHNGRKLNWLHHWSTAAMNFKTMAGCSYELEVTTFQLAVLFCWNDRPQSPLSLESLRVATELPDSELVKALYSLTAFPKLKHQVLLTDAPTPINPKKFTDSTEFRLNHGFKIVKNGREQERGRLSLIGRLQLSLEATVKAEHEEIVALRKIRVQEAIVKVLKARKELPLASLEHEIIDILKQMFAPTKPMIKEQLEWLLDQNFIARKDGHMDIFTYVA